MPEAGYYRFPAIHQETVVFVCEDDLWTVSTSGGIARRLTSNLGAVVTPALSPDGALLAFAGQDEGHPEVYVMPAVGGQAKRLTYLGADARVVGWQPDGESIVFASDATQPFDRVLHLYTIRPMGGPPTKLSIGPAASISYGPDGGIVIGRNTTDLARWKRYRGGLTGDLWIDPRGDGDWRRLIQLSGNVAMPLWLGERIFFASDHEGIGNLYSCLPTGEDLRRHTHHAEYYVRHPTSDGQRIVYGAGADLFVYEPETDRSQLIPIEFHSPRVQRNRKFVDAGWYLQGYDLHPQGHSVALVSRGKPFVMANWEGAVMQPGERNGVRYRLASWLNDGKRLVMVSDAPGEEVLEIFDASGDANADAQGERLDGLDIGRPVRLVVSPKNDQVALSNHRNELILVDLHEHTAKVLDRSRYGGIQGMAWAPDGRWIAYGFFDTAQTSIIKLCRVESGETFPATRPVLLDVGPAFDPGGKYLYLLSYRDFDPVYDNLHFDLNFPWGMRPYLITLRADLPSPFVPVPRAPGQDPPTSQSTERETDSAKSSRDDGADEPAEDKASADSADEGGTSSGNEDKLIEIDLDGITERLVAFPVPDDRYGQIRGIQVKDQYKVLFSTFPVEGALAGTWLPEMVPPGKGRLEVYDFDEQEHDVLVRGITNFEVSQDAKTVICRARNRLRVLAAGESSKNNSKSPSRSSGWVDLDRVKVSVKPQDEWKQMYREAWRLQRDQFWSKDMSGVDWQTVFRRYEPLLERVATRSEFSDLMWEMQGELGTSHAYEMGGDYRPRPLYVQGFLGADLDFDTETDSWHISRLIRGDVWDELASSPFSRPGINVHPGDRLIAIGGRPVGTDVSPAELLVNQAGNQVLITCMSQDGDQPRTVTVKVLGDERPARYREWVEANRQQVHQATEGRVGYIHVPDMGPRGYAEFHRSYLGEVGREGLIVDVRYNSGGHVSALLLEKLARRRLGYDVQRWGEPTPYPEQSPAGPMVALTNEWSGSDGDIFSHTFKLMGLGPLIGTRTWGGVIGVSPRDSLVDGSITTQPEYSLWFRDVGWGVENYGTDPDIEVEIRPQDYAAGCDPQIERAIAEIRKLLAEHPSEPPDFGDRPKLSLPTLPDRGSLA